MNNVSCEKGCFKLHTEQVKAALSACAVWLALGLHTSLWNRDKWIFKALKDRNVQIQESWRHGRGLAVSNGCVSSDSAGITVPGCLQTQYTICTSTPLLKQKSSSVSFKIDVYQRFCAIHCSVLFSGLRCLILWDDIKNSTLKPLKQCSPNF